VSTRALPAAVRKAAHFLAFGFGSGKMPFAPGTFGTLAAIPVYLLLQSLTAPVYAAVVVSLFILGIGLCQVTEQHLGTHDHGSIVWDEIVGYLVTMFMAPSGWEWIVLGFILFRLFDIWKPFPIRQIEHRIRGGFGNMLDDLLAGIYAWLVLQVVAHYVFA
jgi:phosphatidylglycerophosphatase A